MKSWSAWSDLRADAAVREGWTRGLLLSPLESCDPMILHVHPLENVSLQSLKILGRRHSNGSTSLLPCMQSHLLLYLVSACGPTSALQLHFSEMAETAFFGSWVGEASSSLLMGSSWSKKTKQTNHCTFILLSHKQIGQKELWEPLYLSIGKLKWESGLSAPKTCISIRYTRR